jgi:WD40 repeat protein
MPIGIPMNLNTFIFAAIVHGVLTLDLEYLYSQEPVEIRSQGNAIVSMFFSPDGKTLATSGHASFGGAQLQSLRLWNVSDGTLVKQLEPTRGSIIPSVAISPDGEQLVASVVTKKARDEFVGNLCFFNMKSFQLIREIPFGPVCAWNVQYSPDGQSLYAGCYSGYSDGQAEIKRLDALSGDVKEIIPGHPGRQTWRPTCIDISADGKMLAISYSTGSFMIWDIVERQYICNVQAGGNKLYKIKFSGDGKELAICFDPSREISISSVPELQGAIHRADRMSLPGVYGRLGTLDAGGEIYDLTASKSGKWFGLGIKLYGEGAALVRLPEREIAVRLPGPRRSEPVSLVAFSPDDQIMAMASGSTIRLLSIANYADVDYADRFYINSEPRLKEALTQLERNHDASSSQVAVSFFSDPRFSNMILKRVADYKNMRSLILSGTTYRGAKLLFDETPFSKLERNQDLQSIALHQIRLPGFAALSRVPNIRSLKLASETVVDDWSKLMDFNKLDSLDLSEVGFINRGQLAVIGNLPNLRDLRIRTDEYDFGVRRTIEYVDVRELEILKELKNLEVLSLKGNLIDSRVVQTLKTLNQLKYLDISRTKIHDSCRIFLGDMHQLSSLRLGQISPETLLIIAELPNLEELEFDGRFLTVRDIEILRKLKALKKLSISHFWIPENALSFVRKLSQLSDEEKEAYEWIRLLAAINWRFKDAEQNQKGSTLYLGMLEDRRQALDAYATLQSATVDLRTKRDFCALKAKEAVHAAFKVSPPEEPKPEREKLLKAIDDLSR